MELSSEDALCLNVLLAADVRAIRIDESTLTVRGLTPRGEAAVALHPTCRNDQYLRQVRELLSEHALDSPGGYPVYLRRWTRMGQLRDETLPKLLLTGEPEAVVAVVHAPSLTDEIAGYAWWAMPTVENARRMLERECVAQGKTGRILADYLIEYLPFEEEPYAIIETIRFLLHTGLIDAATRAKLWNMGRHNSAYYVGFLEQTPDSLPGKQLARKDWDALRPLLEPLQASGNPYAVQLCRLLSASGQNFLGATQEVLQRPANQEVVNALLDAVGNYFGDLCPALQNSTSMSELQQRAESLCSAAGDDQTPEALRELLATAPQLQPEILAMLILSRVSASIVAPVFSRTTAIGSLMRTKLEPVIQPLLQHIAILRGASRPPATLTGLT
jgi:hypothetical protein